MDNLTVFPLRFHLLCPCPFTACWYSLKSLCILLSDHISTQLCIISKLQYLTLNPSSKSEIVNSWNPDANSCDNPNVTPLYPKDDPFYLLHFLSVNQSSFQPLTLEPAPTKLDWRSPQSQIHTSIGSPLSILLDTNSKDSNRHIKHDFSFTNP